MEVKQKKKKKSPGGDAVKVKAMDGLNKPSKCCIVRFDIPVVAGLQLSAVCLSAQWDLMKVEYL